jgi:hypothetical protein
MLMMFYNLFDLVKFFLIELIFYFAILSYMVNESKFIFSKTTVKPLINPLLFIVNNAFYISLWLA